MDQRVLDSVRAARRASVGELAESITQALLEAGGELRSVREASEGLSALVRAARSGTPQLIGDAIEPVIVLSIDDLASLLAAVREPTMGEILPLAGAEPYVGDRIVIGQGHRRERLKRRGDTPSGSAG